MTAIEVRALQKAFGEKRVLEGVDLAVESGEVFALMGPSGAGKTTLLRILAGLETADGGVARVDRLNGKHVGFVMQRPVVFRRSAFENVAYGLRLQDTQEGEVERRVGAALEEVGLLDLSGAKAWTLSAGEMQRLCFARAAVLDPTVLLLDEFTANLDPANVALLERIVREYHERTRATILIVTHNPFQAKRVAQRAGLLLDGHIVETATVTPFFEDPKDERTRAFVRGEMPY